MATTIPKETETLLQLVHLYFTAPKKDKEAFESFKTRQKQLYANLAANPQIYFSSEFQKTDDTKPSPCRRITKV